MTTKTTPANSALIALPAARHITTAGAAVALVGTFLAWTWTSEFPGDLTVTGYPGGLQVLTLVGAVLTLLFALSGYGIKGLGWLTPGGANSPVRLAALGVLGTTGFTIGAIAVKLGGVVNLEPGAWVSLAGAIIAAVAALGLPADQELDDTTRPTPLNRFINTLRAPAPARAKDLPNWAEILIIAGAFGVALHVFTYGIDTEYAELFIGYIISVAFGFTALTRAGLIARITRLTTKHRNVTLAAALIAAFCFPFTQQNEQYALIGANILIFATVALGLNVVVGLAGLLDLGYVAFLGVGAYAAALVSGSPLSPVGVQFPFWAAVLTGAAASLVFGVVIGAPTLRLRGDYLAIVTLGFGEIFRLTVNALNGVSGPDLTNGSQGIPSIPDLNLFGFDFGVSHDIAGFTLGRSANYYLLMLVFTAVVVLVFRRSGESRIGRAWVAIREDETAATAMGINAFRLKLLAFALGATLAGLAGTVQAHVSYTVTPEQYQFAGSVPPNSAFLLAAVILGGMGTLSGPLVGAALLYLIPAKLQFMQDYQLFLFGIALILLMRFRPEGLVADRRKQLEFHETGQLDVPPDVPLTDQAAGTTKAGA
ncbi:MULTISPECIES: branched-chain amino acid ABC transporter permease [Streptomyces]|uniref:Branched-chain amino acid ABC transporter permease n=2 Tax=Streptomyces TaxID=1883 RepID=A0A6G3SMU6_STRAQ|nr:MULTISPECIES: branched-chain amino acid ABC transporter permease [Streptomyces]NDZ57945.1 branched-chain amino acid ABC transporter permease [Streptomyces anulatus]NEB84284.1 branched-chain amino acid ABC transporter permease [Streptomyces anulatus]OWA19925.1 branched-chain amino acid ABC transporter permease [Streptomyces sp. CS057]